MHRRIEGEVIVEVADEEDWPRVDDTSEAAWRVSLDELERGHELLRDAIVGMRESRLEETVPGKDHSFYVLVHGVVLHDLYHAGQLALLKRADS